ncbi:hypothetical protein LCGC14_1156160 [marine sediment metagenome]|uniref:Uncharacterized protein n=1 Tax=marine sediment metagenome TaxID=412755 RepID=A0A0F9PZI7_9ZZZZ
MATLDSTVGTSTTTWFSGNPYQRDAFYAVGRFWVFYSDGTNFGWRTSTDGAAWSGFTIARAGWNRGYLGSVWFDGTYVHYCFRLGAPSSVIYYRMGLCNAAGTITWQAVEQTVISMDGAHRSNDPAIAVDSNGYPWITYDYQTMATTNAVAYVTKSKTKNGTWTDEDILFAAPYQFSASTFEKAAAPHLWAAVVPLSGGEVYVMAQPGGGPIDETDIKGRLWNGSSWDSEETVAIPVDEIFGASFSPVVDSQDNIHLTYGDHHAASTNTDHYAVIRTYGSGWGSPVKIKDSAVYAQAVLSIDANDILYFFWENEPTVKHIYYRRYINGAWEAVTDWFTEGDVFANEYSSFLAVADKEYKGRIIFIYVTLTVSPFNVKMLALEKGQLSGLGGKSPNMGNKLAGVGLI